MSAVPALHQPQMPPPHWRDVLQEIGPALAEEGRRADQANEFVAGNFKILRERGFLELGVPVELGGAGLSRIELSDMLRALAHYDGATALALAMHTHGVAIAAWRWRHQKAPTDALLRRVASERVQLLTSGGSDWLKSSGTAQKVDGGYHVNAHKVFASGAPAAKLFSTGAIEPNAPDGPTVLQFAVPTSAQGFSIVETWDTLGMRGTGSHDVVLDNVFVPDAAVSVRRKPGMWHPLMHIISMIAIPLVYSVYTGVAEAARDIAVGAVAKKDDHGTIDLIGALDTELESTRSAFDTMMAYCETAQPGPETTRRVAIYRTLVGRGAIKTVDLALDVVGGAAYFRRLGLERLFRDVQAARYHPLGGVSQRQIVGRMALGLPIDA